MSPRGVPNGNGKTGPLGLRGKMEQAKNFCDEMSYCIGRTLQMVEVLERTDKLAGMDQMMAQALRMESRRLGLPAQQPYNGKKRGRPSKADVQAALDRESAGEQELPLLEVANAEPVDDDEGDAEDEEGGGEEEKSTSPSEKYANKKPKYHTTESVRERRLRMKKMLDKLSTTVPTPPGVMGYMAGSAARFGYIRKVTDNEGTVIGYIRTSKYFSVKKHK